MLEAPGTIQLWNMLFTAVERYGVEGTAKILENSIEPEIYIENTDAVFVIDLVTQAFNIETHEMLYNFGRKNERYMALSFCVYYLHDFFKYDMDRIRIWLSQNISVCYKARHQVLRLKPKIPSDTLYCDMKEKMDESVRQYITRQHIANKSTNQRDGK